MVSSELPELLGMCDRIYVMNEGHMVAEMPASEATQEKIMDKATRDERISLMLKTVGLEDSKTKVSKYSKGMTQRLALAQALLEDPELLILDEPTAGLDALGRIEIIELIKKLKEMGKTIVLNSHILSDIERVCDRGIIMKNGVCLGTWEKKTCTDKSLQDLFLELMGGLSA